MVDDAKIEKAKRYVTEFISGKGEIRNTLIGGCGTLPKEVGCVWISEDNETRILYLGKPSKGEYLSEEEIKKIRDGLVNGEDIEVEVKVNEMGEWEEAFLFEVKEGNINFTHYYPDF
jgi:hypothetical protein